MHLRLFQKSTAHRQPSRSPGTRSVLDSAARGWFPLTAAGVCATSGVGVWRIESRRPLHRRTSHDQYNRRRIGPQRSVVAWLSYLAGVQRPRGASCWGDKLGCIASAKRTASRHSHPHLRRKRQAGLSGDDRPTWRGFVIKPGGPRLARNRRHSLLRRKNHD